MGQLGRLAATLFCLGAQRGVDGWDWIERWLHVGTHAIAAANVAPLGVPCFGSWDCAVRRLVVRFFLAHCEASLVRVVNPWRRWSVAVG